MVSELEQQLGEMRAEATQLKEKLLTAEDELEESRAHLSRAQTDVRSLQDAQQEQDEAGARLREKVSRLEVVQSFSQTHSVSDNPEA